MRRFGVVPKRPVDFSGFSGNGKAAEADRLQVRLRRFKRRITPI